MKRIIKLFTLFIGISSIAQNQEVLDKYNLQNKVKVIETTISSGSTGRLRKWTKQHFNESGFLTKEESKYSSNGRINKRQIFYNTQNLEVLDTKKKKYGRTEYVYDNNDKLIEIIYPNSKTLLTYRNDGKIEKEVNRNTDKDYIKSIFQYEYNLDDSYKIVAKYYLEDGQISHESNSIFNTRDLIIEKTSKNYKTLYFYKGNMLIKEEDYKDGFLRESKVYEYEKNGLLTKETQIADGKTESYTIEYDDFGNTTKVIERDDIDSFTYEYDDQNNWVKRKKYNNTELGNITTRIIEYYGDNVVKESKPIPFALADVKPKIGNCKKDNCFGVELTNLLKESIPENRYIEFGITNSKRFNISFVIEKDGSITNIVVHRAFKDFKEHLIKKLQSINNIVPGQKNNEPVRTQFSIPLIFK
ncbi:hypothetical protein [Ascidiimonas sp. W6]|uniref:hypothetical protein n=1 Tax=Ascidiimonas meishanensis TaxID=3128903 RepID=UPI0030EE6ECA